MYLLLKLPLWVDCSPMVWETGVQKMLLDAALLNTQHYKVWIKGKVEQSREWSSALLHLSVVAIERGAFRLPLTKVTNFTFTSRVFANGPRDQGSIPGRAIPKTQKMVLDASLLNPQQYMVNIKGKVEQSREWSSTLSITSV